MNRRKRKTIALLLVALLGVTLIKYVAYADDASPTIYAVTDYESWKSALSLAKDGDIIGILGTVKISKNMSVGNNDKHLIIERMSQDANITFEIADYNFENITFDGKGLKTTYSFVILSGNCIFENCIFQNCGDMQSSASSGSLGGAVNVSSGTSQFNNCQFTQNAGIVGGHIAVGAAKAELNNCTLTDGSAISKGGAIAVVNSSGECIINSSVITGNSSGDYGGGVSNSGTVTVTGTKIYANSAVNGGADIGNTTTGNITLNDSLDDLIDLFASDNILPTGWVCDYDFEENIYIPDVNPSQENALMKLNYDIIPESGTDEPGETSEEPDTSTEQPIDDKNQGGADKDSETETPSDSGTTNAASDSSDKSVNDADDSSTSDSPNSESAVTITNTTTNMTTNTTTDNSSNDTSSSSSTDSSTHSSVTNTDNSSSDSSSHAETNTTTTTDNSDRSSVTTNDSSDRSTVNYNYYTTVTQNPAKSQVQQSDNGTVIVMPGTSTNDTGGVLVQSDKGQETEITAPNIRIDAKGVDCTVELIDGVYNISINADSSGDNVQVHGDADIDWIEVIQIILLVVLLICLIWKPKSIEMNK
jgi:hypothetical protein